MTEFLRYLGYALTIPWRIGRDLLGPDDFDTFIAEQRQRFLDMHEGE